jgi:HIV Tat-specific factor 1
MPQDVLKPPTEQDLAAIKKPVPKEEDEGGEGGKGKKRKKDKKKKWKARENNSNVYVEGLPPDITEDEMYDFFKKCGVIVTDLATEKPRIKVYKDEAGHAKGDGLVTYAKPEAVTLALQFLDDGYIRQNCQVKVTRAEFTQKGETFVEKSKGVHPCTLQSTHRRFCIKVCLCVAL